MLFKKIIANFFILCLTACGGGDEPLPLPPAPVAPQQGKFIKIGSSGEVLADTSTTWKCVKDNTTGLLWEVKTNDGGLHDHNVIFTNISTEISSYAEKVNTENLCGRNDWRLPTAKEISSLIKRENPIMHLNFFPYFLWQDSMLKTDLYWSSNVGNYNSIQPSYSTGYTVQFKNGLASENLLRGKFGVTLVSGNICSVNLCAK